MALQASADAADYKASFDKLYVDSAEQKAQLDKASADAAEYKAGFDKVLVDAAVQKAQLDKVSHHCHHLLSCRSFDITKLTQPV